MKKQLREVMVAVKAPSAPMAESRTIRKSVRRAAGIGWVMEKAQHFAKLPTEGERLKIMGAATAAGIGWVMEKAQHFAKLPTEEERLKIMGAAARCR